MGAPPAPPTSARGVSDTGAFGARHHMHASTALRPWTAPSSPSKPESTHPLHALRGATRVTRLSLASVDYEADDGPGDVVGSTFLPTRGGARAVTCAATIVAAICGFPSLSLPYAVAQLGWGTGMATVTLAGCATATLATSLVASLVEHPPGVRHATYSALAGAHLGSSAARAVQTLQAIACVGACVSTLLIGGGAIKSAAALALTPFNRPPPHLALCIWAFAAVQASSAALARGRAAAAAAAVGAAAFAAAAALAVGLSIAAGRAMPPQPHTVPDLPPTDRAISVMVAIGLIVNNLSIGIVPELSAAAAPPVARTMNAATLLAFAVIVPAYITVAAAGYAAFGSNVHVVLLESVEHAFRPAGSAATVGALAAAWAAVAVNTYAVFNAYAVPLYDAAWSAARRHVPRAPWLATRSGRFAGRAALVAVCALAASALPFFGELGALFGAVMVVLDYTVPPLCVARSWCGGKGARCRLAAAAARTWAVITAALAAAILAASLVSLTRSAAALRLFADV